MGAGTHCEHDPDGGVEHPVALADMTRVFQDLGNGMAKCHLGLRFPDVPMPYPYIAVAEMALYAHAVMTPIVSSQWCADTIPSAVSHFCPCLHVVESLHRFRGTRESRRRDERSKLRSTCSS